MKNVNKNDAKKWKEFIDTMNDDEKSTAKVSTFDEAFEHAEMTALFELVKVILLLGVFALGLVLLINHLL